MDKNRLTGFINDENLKVKMYRVIDICNNVLKNYSIKHTEFLNPFEIKTAISIINFEDNLKFYVDGGFEDSERSIIYVFPYFYEFDEYEDEGLKFLQIRGNFKFSSIGHKDYLGSLLGLGIKREKIGDILVHDDFCQVVVDSDISDYILINYEKVGKSSIKVSEISREEISRISRSFIEKNIVVSSLRLDNVISKTYSLSRSESDRLIRSGFVYVNYERILSLSKEVDEGFLISVRGHGRFIVDEVGTNTRKNKIKIKVKIYND